jgi:hypothetical protein
VSHTAGRPLVVGKKLYCAWDPDLGTKNRDFLAGVDPSYYAYVAEVHGPLVAGEQAKHAALAIRLAYSQALETFFALLGAAIQAPHAAVAWVLLYKANDLKWLVEQLVAGAPVRTLLRDGDTSWRGLAAAMHKLVDDPEQRAQLTDACATLWAQFAADFLDKPALDEYNSIKHGLRARTRGLTVSVAPAAPDGGPPPDEAFLVLGAADFGGGFYVKEPAAKDKGARGNIRLRYCYRSWTPEHLVAGLELLAISIHNVLTTLRVEAGGARDALHFLAPEDAAAFARAALAQRGFWTEAQHGPPPDPANYCTPEQILAFYDAAEAKGREEPPAPPGPPG